MPITCPLCNSENVVVVSRVLVEQYVTGELCAPQEWDPAKVIWDTSEVAFAQCKACGEQLGVVMVDDMLAALTQKSAANLAGDLEPEARQFTHDENEEVCRVSLLLQSQAAAKPTVIGKRVYIWDGVQRGQRENELVCDKDVPVSCSLAAYEHYQRTRPDLCLPELDVTATVAPTQGTEPPEPYATQLREARATWKRYSHDGDVWFHVRYAGGIGSHVGQGAGEWERVVKEAREYAGMREADPHAR